MIKTSDWKEEGLPTGGCFGYIGDKLILGKKHHQLIMAKLIDAGWTWEQMMEAPQAWGWFEVHYPHTDSQYVHLSFTSDAGFQNEAEKKKATEAFESLYGLNADPDYDYGHGVDTDEDEYGSGLHGKDNINNYLGEQHYLKHVTDVPPPPGGVIKPPDQGEQLNLFDHPVPGGGNPPPKKVPGMPLWIVKYRLLGSSEGENNGPSQTIEVNATSKQEAIDMVQNTIKQQGGIFWFEGIEKAPSGGGFNFETGEFDFNLHNSSMKKFADWNDIMEKAQKIRQMPDGVQIQVNAPDHVVGTVHSGTDDGSYNTEIWRDDPNSQAITMWNCDCPWSDYSWGRTRQWKKYEGRPCAHVLALFWQAQTQPPAGGNAPPNTPMAPAPSQTPPVPIPGGDMVQQQGLISPIIQPPLITAVPPPVVIQQAPIQPGPSPTSTGQSPTSGPTPAMSQPVLPGEEGVLGLPGTLSHWKESTKLEEIGWGGGNAGDPERPWIYDHVNDTVYLGPEGDYHANLIYGILSTYPYRYPDEEADPNGDDYHGSNAGDIFQVQTSAGYCEPGTDNFRVQDGPAVPQSVIEALNIRESSWKASTYRIGDWNTGDSSIKEHPLAFVFLKGQLYVSDSSHNEIYQKLNETRSLDSDGIDGLLLPNHQLIFFYGDSSTTTWKAPDEQTRNLILSEFDANNYTRIPDKFGYPSRSLSSWQELKISRFESGDIVRTKYEIVGEEPMSGAPYSIPPSTSGEVLYSDAIETHVIFPLAGGILSPHVIKVEGLTSEFYSDPKAQPFIKQR